MSIEFTGWPKTSRFFRDITITEKIDGTNAAIGITRVASGHDGAECDAILSEPDSNAIAYEFVGDGLYVIYAQSRNKLIKLGQDNAGFAGWVSQHTAELVTFLGEGLHFGEWWGSGIQRGYGLTKGEKRFSLFNTHRFKDIQETSGGLLHCVPVLYEGPLVEKEITNALNDLRDMGSVAGNGFTNPEGICIYHSASRLVQKVTLDNNDAGKWEHL